MLQTVYGTSNIVWANVIGLVLFFLTMGYFLGGRLADRHPNERTFFTLVTVAGFSSVFFLLLTSVILKQAANALATIDVGPILSSLVGVIIAQAIPITLLGCISPFAIRLGVRDVGESGRVSGLIYSISTMGSLLGTYLPVLWIIPAGGTRVSAIVSGTPILIIGLIGLWRTNRRSGMVASLISLVLVPIAIMWTQGGIKEYPGQIFETESAYNYIQVIEQGDCNYLLLNEGQAFHSFYCEGGRVPRISVWSIMLAAPYFKPDPTIDSMAVIGLAAGTIPKQFSRVYDGIPIDGIELDPEIVQAGRDYFALTEPNINIIVGDGRYELNQLPGRYSVITIDAYKVPYIPWHLTTSEFFQEVHDHLHEDGVVAVNVGRVPNDRRLIEAMTATMLTVFPTVHAIDVPGSLNTILVATVEPTTVDSLQANLAELSLDSSADPLLMAAVQTAAENIVPAPAGEIIFTDERAPLETIVDSLVIRYLLENGPAGLPGLGGG